MNAASYGWLVLLAPLLGLSSTRRSAERLARAGRGRPGSDAGRVRGLVVALSTC